MTSFSQNVVGLSVCRYDYRPGWKLVSHRHSTYYQIFHLFEGDGIAWIQGEPHNLIAGAVLFIPPGIEHGLRPTGKHPLRTLDVKFRIHAPALVRLTLGLAYLQEPKSEEIYLLLEAIRQEAEKRDAYFQEICQLKLVELLYHLARHSHSETAGSQATAIRPVLPLPHLEHPLAQDFLRFLDRHHGEPISADRLEHELAYSYRHLSETTRAVFGRTPQQVIAAFRIDCAQRALAETERPLKAIANDCGFANVHHFSRTFKQFFGIAPGAWRQQVRGTLYRHFSIDPNFADRDRTQR